MSYTDWEGNVRFRIDEPGFQWLGQKPVTEGDGITLVGMDENRSAVAVCLDGEGNKVWKTVMPVLSDLREYALLDNLMKTADGGYLATLLENTEDGVQACAVVRLDPEGRLLWLEQLGGRYWVAGENNGKIAAASTGDAGALDFVWFDADGNRLGDTHLEIAEADLPRYVDSGNMFISVEKVIPAADGLWALLNFWENDDPDAEEPEPAWTQQDCALARIPEP